MYKILCQDFKEGSRGKYKFWQTNGVYENKSELLLINSHTTPIRFIWFWPKFKKYIQF